MKFYKNCLVLLALASFLLSSPDASFSKPGGSRSYSSGRSSSYSRPSYSSGRSSSYKPSYSSGSKSSYSSGSKSGASKSGYSSGKSNYSSGSKPSSTGKSGYSSGSGKSYSSGSNKSTSSGNSYTSSPGSGRTSSTGFSKNMTASQRNEASKKAYQSKIASSTPKTTYKSSSGSTVKVDTPVAKKTQQTVRNYVTHERYVTYDNRARGFYGNYYSSPVYYNDYFSPFLMGYLLSDALNTSQRASWMYHHRDEMDDARYQAMLAKDAKLEAEIAALKAQNVARNPDYVPEGMDRDIMYDDDFVYASLGVEEGYTPIVEPEESGGDVWIWVFIIGLVVFVVGGLVYLLFIKDF